MMIMAPRYPATLIQAPDHYEGDDDDDIERFNCIHSCVCVCVMYIWGPKKMRILIDFTNRPKRIKNAFLGRSICSYVLTSNMNFPRSYFWGANKIERVSHLWRRQHFADADADSYICCSRWFPDFIFASRFHIFLQISSFPPDFIMYFSLVILRCSIFSEWAKLKKWGWYERI